MTSDDSTEISLEQNDLIEAAAFVHPQYIPKNEATAELMRTLSKQLDLGERDVYVAALSSFVVACKTARAKGSNLIAFPGDANYYAEAGFGYRVAVKTRDALIAKGYLELIQKPQKGYSAVYQFGGIEPLGQFTSMITWPVRIRETKQPGQQKGRLQRRHDSVRRFGSTYLHAEVRVKKLNKVYDQHSFTSPDGISWAGVHRVFNNGSLECGGRLYGDWQQLKEEKRLKLTIDGEEVAEIDITACYLFIASVLSGHPIIDKDPYASISWVEGKLSRDLAKRLVASIISMDGPLKSFPRGTRDQFNIPKKDHLNDYQDPILSAFPVLKNLSTTGLEVMYNESEAVFACIEALADKGIIVYPVHDCIIVQKHYWEAAATVLQDSLKHHFGAVPWLTVGFSGEQDQDIAPPGLT